MLDKKRQQRQLLDIRKIFVIALAGGVLGVSLPQYFDLPELAVALPLFCMVIYVWRGYSLSNETPFLEQFADSVYYLGFLLTLVALVVALYFYQGDTLDAGLLTANFSLALITTIFGLAVRIFINNFQVDLNHVEHLMMVEVDHAANDMIRKAKLISMQLDVSHQETQIAIKKSIDAAAEGMEATANTIDKYAQVRSKALLQNTQQTHQAIDNAVQMFEEKMQAIKFPQEIFADKLATPLEQIVTCFDETQVLLKEMNAGQVKISQSTKGLVGSITQSVAEVDILAQSIGVFNDKLYANIKINDDFVKVFQDISSLAEKTGDISENIQNQTEQSALAMQNYTKMVAAVDSLPDEVETLAERLKQSSEQISVTFQSLSNNTESGAKISSDLDEITAALSNTRQTVEQISDFGMHVTTTYKRLESFNQLLEQHTQLLADMSGVAQIDIDLAKQHQKEMAEILQKSRQSLAQRQKEFENSGFKAGSRLHSS